MAEKIMLGGELVAELVAGPSAYEVAVEQGFVGSVQDWLDSLQGDPGVDGSDGSSAYQLAVANGFVGTEAEWLASLQGADGEAGASAYEIAVQGGFVGTESDWLDSLQGDPGEKGDKGDPGLSAYEVAVQGGFVGTQAEWLASLEGADGLDGTDGINGLDGLSAYEVAVQEGFVGSEADWLASLKGEKGDQGDQGLSAYQVAVANGFEGTEEEWVASLEGLSAYEVAVANGFVGSEAEWVASLEGEKGDKGDQGPPSVLTGEIKMVGGGVPAGYLPCDGSTVSRSEFPGLFSVVGTQFGSGDGVSTFGLPRFSGPLGLQGDFDLGGLTDLIEGTGDFETPDPDPSVAFTNLATNPSFETVYSTVEVARNRFPNPGFRESQTGWGSSGVVPITRVASENTVTGYAIQAAYAAGTNHGVYTPTKLPVSAGEIIPVAFTHWGAVTDSFQIELRFWNSVGTMLVQNATPFTITSAVTRTVATSVVAPAGTTTMDIVLRKLTSSSAHTVFFGDFVTSADGKYFDGSFSPDPDLTPSWAGTVNNSTSTLTAPGIQGIVPSIQTKTFQSSAWANSGGVSARIIPATSSTDTFLSPGGDAGAMRFGMEAGKTYTAVAVLKMDAPLTGTLLSRSRSIAFWYRVGTGQYIGSSDQIPAPNEAGVHLVRYTFTVPANATEAWVRLYHGGSLGSGEVWWDDFTIVEGTRPGLMPFHGGHSSIPDTVTRWTGTAHASTSELLQNRSIYDPERNVPCVAGPVTYQSSQSWSKSGSRSVLIDGSGQFSANEPDPYAVLTASTSLAHMAGGNSYTVVGWLRLVAAGDDFPMARRFVLDYMLNGEKVFEYGPQAFNGPGVYPLGAVFTVPEGATSVHLNLGGNGARPQSLEDIGGVLAWWDDVKIVEGVHEHLLPDSSVGFVIKT